MAPTVFRTIACAAILVLVGCSAGNSAGQLLPTRSSSATAVSSGLGVEPRSGNVRDVCTRPARIGEVRCLALVRSDVAGAILGGYHGSDLARAFAPAATCRHAIPYCPADLQSAYGITPAASVSGGGRVVAVVDAYGYPGAASDLAVYRSAMKLSACSSGDGCLRIVNQQGQAGNLPPANVEWDGEQALDLDMISAICPKCTIVLVQANSSRFRDLGAAVDTAVALGAVSVSNSYGGNEWSADDRMFDHPGHVITASSGDTGAGVEQPCSFAGVVCVGGTSLTNATNARGWNEVAWADGISNGTGSGCSKRVAKPVWQTDKGCTNRSEADISAVADPYTGVAVFESAGGGWRQFGGTSVSSPIVAAMFALAGNTAAIDAPQWIWQHGGTAAFNDVVFGSNPGRFRCPSNMLYICEAGPGYDGPTGWGTPSGLSGL